MEYKAKLDYPQLAETLTVEEQLKAMTEDRNLLWECYNSVIAERNKYKDALEAIAKGVKVMVHYGQTGKHTYQAMEVLL